MTMDPEKQTLEEAKTQHPGQEWEAAAREWLSSLPEGTALTVTEVENWVKSEGCNLPDQIKSTAVDQLFQKLLNFQNAIVPVQERNTSQADSHPARFQRSELWRPVYTWLESLKTDELIKSQEILDWLTANPEIRDQLYERHSRYHLMHYIKKCHMKILKKRDKKKGVQPVPNPKRIQKTEATNPPAPVPYIFAGTATNTIPKDSHLYAAKRSEAQQKYEILVELEKQLSVLFPNPHSFN